MLPSCALISEGWTLGMFQYSLSKNVTLWESQPLWHCVQRGHMRPPPNLEKFTFILSFAAHHLQLGSP